MSRLRLFNRFVCAGIFILLGALLTAVAARADEQLPSLKVNGDIFTNVTVTSVSDSDIYFTFAGGLGSAKLKDLDAATQKHFNYDPAKAQPTGPNPNDPQAVMDDAMSRVHAIVNQPVPEYRVTDDMQVAIYQPGWFHPGAITPDFNNVDIRGTQDLNYGQHQYVSSDINPGICFPGGEVEFNSMTKYFYIDRSLPKKKLTEAEMLEINRLYRIIGASQKKIADHAAIVAAASDSPGSTKPGIGASDQSEVILPATPVAFVIRHANIFVTAAAVLLLALMATLNLLKARS